ncbi:MFS transporter [Bacillus rubiinfantis]|uniref:MFS transporter n=1 Tax=Bacillus rubiinfantis TaxID=1499680 RepID=UPI0005AB59A9|nr:MFS transporter [Bacillus rubiinfantis]
MLMVGNLFVFMSFQMLIPIFPPYIKSLGAEGIEIGLVTALFSIGAVLSRPIIGFMLEYRARKAIVLMGAVLLLVITVFYPLSRIIFIFLLFRFLHGLAWGWSTTVNGTAAADTIPMSRLGEGMGYYGLSVTIGMVIAPSLGILLYGITSFKNLIFISAILGIIAVILFIFANYRTPETVRQTRREDLKFTYFGSFIDKTAWFPAFITLLISLGYGTITTFIVIFGQEREISHIFLFYIVNAIFSSVSRPFAGRWFDEKGPRGLVVMCTIITFAGMWVLSFAHSDFSIAIAGGLFGIGFGCVIPTLQSWALVITPEHRRGVVNGMIFSAIDLGIGISGLIFGLVAQFLETATLFRLGSLFFIAAIFIVAFAEKRKQQAIVEKGVS